MPWCKIRTTRVWPHWYREWMKHVFQDQNYNGEVRLHLDSNFRLLKVCKEKQISFNLVFGFGMICPDVSSACWQRGLKKCFLVKRKLKAWSRMTFLYIFLIWRDHVFNFGPFWYVEKWSLVVLAQLYVQDCPQSFKWATHYWHSTSSAVTVLWQNGDNDLCMLTVQVYETDLHLWRMGEMQTKVPVSHLACYMSTCCNRYGLVTSRQFEGEIISCRTGNGIWRCWCLFCCWCWCWCWLYYKSRGCVSRKEFAWLQQRLCDLNGGLYH